MQYVEYWDDVDQQWVQDTLPDSYDGNSYGDSGNWVSNYDEPPVQLDPITNDPGVSQSGLSNDYLDQAWNAYEGSGMQWEDFYTLEPAGNWWDGVLGFLGDLQVSPVITQRGAPQQGGGNSSTQDPRYYATNQPGGTLNSTSYAYLGLAAVLVLGGFVAAKTLSK